LRVLRGHRTGASFVTCSLILLLIVLPVTFGTTMVARQSIALYHTLQNRLDASGGDPASRLEALRNQPWARWVELQAGRLLGTGALDLQAYPRQSVIAASRWVVSRGPSLLAGVGGILFSFVLMFITMFFLFRDGPKIMGVIRVSNPLPAAYGSEIVKKFQDVSFAVFYGSILTAIVQGSAAALLFWALGVFSPLFWGAMVAPLSLVPILGASIVWVPMGLYFFLADQPVRAIILLAVGMLIISSIDNVLKPAIIKGRTDMHPLLVFFSVLGGMQVFGFLGVLLGPLAVALFISFLNFYRSEFVRGSQAEASDEEQGR